MKVHKVATTWEKFCALLLKSMHILSTCELTSPSLGNAGHTCSKLQPKWNQGQTKMQYLIPKKYKIIYNSVYKVDKIYKKQKQSISKPENKWKCYLL